LKNLQQIRKRSQHVSKYQVNSHHWENKNYCEKM